MHFTTFESMFVVGSIALHAALFLCIQCMALRKFLPQRILLSSVVVYVLSTVIFLAIVSLTCGNLFPSVNSFLNYAVILASGSLGIVGLYTFLGPVTADRSATAQMLMFLVRNESPLPLGELFAAFDADQFLQKRLTECRESHLICIDGQSVTLTRQGAAIAAMFAYLSRQLQVDGWPGHSHPFRT